MKWLPWKAESASAVGGSSSGRDQIRPGLGSCWTAETASSLVMTQSRFRLGSAGQIAAAYTLRFESPCVMFFIHWMASVVMTLVTANLICSAMRSTRMSWA